MYKDKIPWTTHLIHNCIDDYVDPNNIADWLPCPNCKLKPKVWLFNNGRHTACGCWETTYDHFSISAESIMSVHNRTKGKINGVYKGDELQNNWNHFCVTKEILFKLKFLGEDSCW